MTPTSQWFRNCPGAQADGGTRQEALAGVELVIAEWVETATELGRVIPQPVAV